MSTALRRRRWPIMWPLVVALLTTLVAGLPPTATDAAQPATLTVAAPSVAPGQAVAVTGAGFPKLLPVTIEGDDATAGVPAVRTDWRGTFSIRVTIPASAPLGARTLRASAPRWSGARQRVEAQVRLMIMPPLAAPSPVPTATPTPTPSPTATPTAVPPTPTPTSPVPPGGKLFGVNIAGAEFGETRLPGSLDRDYTYPADPASQGYFAAKGLTLVRLPFRWERLQPVPFGPLSAADVAGLRAALDVAGAAGQRVILDMHNYGRYYGTPLGRADAAQFVDAWERLANEFRGHPALHAYELMNEPHDLPDGGTGWAELAQSATDAVRRHDTDVWVLVPGYGWQSARFWPENNRTLDVRDRAGKLLYAAHQYFDADYTGTYVAGYDADRAHPSIGAERVRPFLEWLASRNARGMLTEYGVPDNDPRWLEVLNNFLATLEAEPSIVGGTYWAAGPWWGDYPLSIEPRDGQDRPQMATLAQHPTRP